VPIDPTWEDLFRTRRWGRYPPEELVRFVARTFPAPAGLAALDLGCGGGANTWFLAREGFAVVAIDGAPAAIEQTRAVLDRDGLSARLIIGDLAALEVGKAAFDVAVDVNAIQHNSRAGAELIVSRVHDALRRGGWFFTMLVGTDTTGYDTGANLGDGTFRDITIGPLAGRGIVRSYEREDVIALLAGFGSVSIDRSDRTDRDGEYRVSHWVASGRK